MKLINAEEVMDYLDNCCHYSDSPDYDTGYGNGINVAWSRLLEIPAIEPVHAAGGCYCKECEYHEKYMDSEDLYFCYLNGNSMPLNGFCSEGKVSKDNG